MRAHESLRSNSIRLSCALIHSHALSSLYWSRLYIDMKFKDSELKVILCILGKTRGRAVGWRKDWGERWHYGGSGRRRGRGLKGEKRKLEGRARSHITLKVTMIMIMPELLKSVNDWGLLSLALHGSLTSGAAWLWGRYPVIPHTSHFAHGHFPTSTNLACLLAHDFIIFWHWSGFLLLYSQKSHQPFWVSAFLPFPLFHIF